MKQLPSLTSLLLLLFGSTAQALPTEIKTGRELLTCLRNSIQRDLAWSRFQNWEKEPEAINQGGLFFAAWSNLFNWPGCNGNEYAEFVPSPDPQASGVQCRSVNQTEDLDSIACSPTIEQGEVLVTHLCFGPEGPKNMSRPFAFVRGSKLYCYNTNPPQPSR